MKRLFVTADDAKSEDTSKTKSWLTTKKQNKNKICPHTHAPKNNKTRRDN